MVRRFDRHRQLHCRFGHGHGFIGTPELGAIDHVCPVNQLFHRTRIEPKFFFRHMRQELGAGPVIGIVKLLLLVALAIMLSVLRRKKGALVMVKPPGDLGRRRVLKIDDHVFIAIEVALVKKRSGAMHQTAELEGCVRANALAVEAIKHGRRCGSVKALAVVEHPYFQSALSFVPLESGNSKATRNDIRRTLLSSDRVWISSRKTNPNSYL